ncbi:MAG: cytochrome c biogenesis protein CcsA, partial [Bacteroidota bacterium]
MEGGTIGEIFTSLAFASALVSMLSFWVADQREGLEKEQWIRFGVWGFRIHALGILGIIGTLFALIYTHNYSYHYVWSHSSNELPVYYMISCFWEGQEGSFLLWCFWHSVLGLIVMHRRNSWTPGVMAIIASVELILTSMLLGIYINGAWVSGIYVLAAILPGLYLGWRFAQQRELLPLQGNFHLASACMAGLFLLMMVRGQLGFEPFLFPSGGNLSLSGFAFWMYTLGLIAYSVLFLVYLAKSSRQEGFDIWEPIAGAALIGISIAGLWYAPELWKAGSTPFIKLKAVFPDEAIYQTNPDFVPSNGTGLNPLLQNYWMVIHPPTLFLGFASTLIPFSYVMAALIRRDYTGWIKPSLPWTSFSVMILGIGIIMGGYWAYETLNFGGYWNWDPVENSSLVPWLCGVASLHAMLIYRKTKAYLKMAMILIISTFLLVLYSTFLTRSGILGETSVHTFTDLGLSGQLLVLLLAYMGFVLITMILRWKEIPQRADESKMWSAEFMLFVGILIFAFSSLVIILATSLPVINAIFGTNFAPPAEVQLFYYKWNVWFAILFGAASGMGQFLWWKIKGKKTISDALFRPFLLAVLSGSAILLTFWLSTDLTFAYDQKFADALAFTKQTGNSLQVLLAYITYGVLSVADELLLFSALFGFFANVDVLIQMLLRNRKGLKVMGGTVVHIGFALMLLGMLFSSGYDDVISINYRPSDLAAFPENERNDNVLLPRGYETPIKGFRAAYEGKLEAQ